MSVMSRIHQRVHALVEAGDPRSPTELTALIAEALVTGALRAGAIEVSAEAELIGRDARDELAEAWERLMGMSA
ncbi:MAG: hypothetical protein ACREOJ_11435 [Gemmatimonadaceae bacterium]